MWSSNTSSRTKHIIVNLTIVYCGSNIVTNGACVCDGGIRMCIVHCVTVMALALALVVIPIVVMVVAEY